VVAGLLSNATKFTERGAITLTGRLVADEQIEIAVRDTGIGIDPKDFPTIFEGFRQLDASLTRRIGGLGLGLALAHELVRILGGSVDVDSQRNRGATFRVRLPLRPPSATEAAVRREREVPEAVLAAVACRALA
jgi:signal transduction histidine kinase